MGHIVNTIFCDEIFSVIKPDFLAAILFPQSGAPRWPLHRFLLKMSNTRSPITLERNSLALQNLTQICSFKLSSIS